MTPRLVVDPVKAGLDGETRQHAVLRPVSVTRRYIDGASLEVQRVAAGRGSHRR